MKQKNKEHHCIELEMYGKCRHGYEYTAIGNYGKGMYKKLKKAQDEKTPHNSKIQS